MKMKNYISVLLAAALLLTSCSLDEKSYGFYSNDNFYKSEKDAVSALLYAYNALTFLEYSRGIFYLGDIPTETMSPKTDEAGDVYQLENWICTNETEQLEYYFKFCYIAINRANSVLANIEGASVPETVARRISGEAYFLRAWNYFNLMRNFGKVPIHTEAVSELGMTTAPMAENLDEIFDLIRRDCWTAISLLDVNKEFGRADKVAAESLLAKTYLTVASAKENRAWLYSDMDVVVSEMYDSSAFYAGRVINDYKAHYDFDPDLKHIYDVNYPDGPEHIFIMPIERSGTQEGNYSKLPLMFLPSNSAIPFYIKYSDGSLQRANGNGWGVFLCNDAFVENTFSAVDKRRTELIHRDIYDASGNPIIPNQVKGYFTSKYVDPDFVGERTSARPYLIRFSDIALVYAEAAGPVDGLPVLNMIRSRAGLAPLPAGLDVDVYRREVIKERALELAFEGNRLYDLRRTASVTVTDMKAFGLSEMETAFFPIPQREIDLNPNL